MTSLIYVISLALPSIATASPLEGRDFVPGEIIIGFENSQGPDLVEVDGHQLTRIERLPGIDASLYAVPERFTVREAVQ